MLLSNKKLSSCPTANTYSGTSTWKLVEYCSDCWQMNCPEGQLAWLYKAQRSYRRELSNKPKHPVRVKEIIERVVMKLIRAYHELQLFHVELFILTWLKPGTSYLVESAVWKSSVCTLHFGQISIMPFLTLGFINVSPVSSHATVT